MKKILKKLKLVEKEILNKKSELVNMETLPYYKNIVNEFTKKRDRSEIMIELKSLFSKKFALLESLQIKISVEKCDVSESERLLIMNINSNELSHAN